MESRYQAFVLILASSLLILIIYLNFPLKPKNDPSILPAKLGDEWTMIATGDVMLGRTVMTTSLDKSDPLHPWRNVADKLKAADLTFINLENPIVENCPRHYSGFKFCTDPAMVAGLDYAGVDVITLANNHIGNYGNVGILETKKILADNNFSYTLNSLAVHNIKGTEVGFVGLNLVDRKELDKKELDLIQESSARVDVLIVSPHWGYEYQSRSSKYQKAMAAQIITAGADLIIGSHPHWVQESDQIQGKKVYYSLGNFIFDQMWSEETKKGLAVKFTFKADTLVKEESMPIYMTSWAQPNWSNN